MVRSIMFKYNRSLLLLLLLLFIIIIIGTSLVLVLVLVLVQVPSQDWKDFLSKKKQLIAIHNQAKTEKVFLFKTHTAANY